MLLFIFLSFLSLGAGGPSSLPYLAADFPIQFCASEEPTVYDNVAICTIRLFNMGETTLTGAQAFFNVTNGEVLEDDLTGIAGPCKSFASLGRIVTTGAAETTFPATTFEVTSAANFAASGVFYAGSLVEVAYTGISGNSFTGLTMIRGSGETVSAGVTVQGTSDGSMIDATDITFTTTDDPVFGPTMIRKQWLAPEFFVQPPPEVIIMQVAMKGDGLQTLRGSISFASNPQIPTDLPVCCGCCSPKCPCRIWRRPSDVVGPLCNYQEWLRTGGNSCSACDIRVKKEWTYCELENEIKYGAHFEVVNPFGTVFELGTATYTVQAAENCTACGDPFPNCFPSNK